MKHADSLHEISLQNLIGPKQPEPITGVASVIDGDTIEVHGQRIRFNGIDAPEQHCDDAKGFEYPCGGRSAAALDTFPAASRPVQCTFVTWDRDHRFVGDCRRADGVSHTTPSLSRSSFPPHEQFCRYHWASSQELICLHVRRGSHE
ncbi:thermonuclease family protein [Mesorhizobium captivum]|uniref:thermonuclease family protein n=1 Tax=Mesorhizobium captivum TaxID=3072319 RepID=UPI002A23BC22|nr:thermonuclease family protein [Mesorhizobium sp. VK22B]